MVLDGQLNSMVGLSDLPDSICHHIVSDRLSDLPDSILHQIISFLGTEESCRTSILSKRWVNVWSTDLILDFRTRFFKGVTVDRFVDFIDTTMQRYSEHNLTIRKLKFEYPYISHDMAGRIDKWLGIAVQNKVEVLSLSAPDCKYGRPSYGLPVILFSAQSLTSMKCFRVRVPLCQSLKLISLQYLHLSQVVIDEHMLQHILMSCPLNKLLLDECSGIKNISIPSCSKVELLHVGMTIPIGGSIELDTSSIRRFSYRSVSQGDPWPFIFKPASRKNLRVLSVSYVHMKDIIFDKLVSELSSIKIMNFYYCTMPENIRIASLTLEKLDIHDCFDLVNIALDAPKLETFCYTGDLELSSVTSTHSICDARLHLIHSVLETESFCHIKRLLSRSKCCKVLSLEIDNVPKIEFHEDQLSAIHDSSPYDVEEVKLSLSCSSSEKSLLMALINGLFWSCRPAMLSLAINLAFDNQNAIVRTLLETMEEKANCWKHPLKRFEIEDTTCSRLTGSWNVELRLRLHW